MLKKPKSKISLIGLRQAKKELIFFHEGPLGECKGCDLYKICMMNLEPKRVYKIVQVLEKMFPCRVHEEGVKVVKVVEPDMQVTIENKYAFPQGIITYKLQKCKETSCKYYSKCVPLGLREGDKGKILDIICQVQCRLERPLVLVTLRRLNQVL